MEKKAIGIADGWNLEGKGSSSGGKRIMEDINDKFSIKKINYLIDFIFA